jgi:hypothetical protein
VRSSELRRLIIVGIDECIKKSRSAYILSNQAMNRR